jgi:hypothetical protein
MTLADLLGCGTEVEFEGERITVRSPSVLEQAEFAAWLKDRAKREAAIPPHGVDPAAHAAYVRETARGVGEGWYEPDAPGYCAALANPADFTHLLWLILKTDRPKITKAAVQGMVERGLREVFLRVVAAEDDLDPKVLAAVLRVLGFPPDYLTTPPPTPNSSASG